MRWKLGLVVGATMVAASSAAWSQDDLKRYLGIAVGETRMKACEGAASSISCDDRDSAFRFFGGYRFAPQLAGEIGVSFLGTARASTGESADLSALDVSALAGWPLGNRFRLFGRLGLYLGQTDAAGNAVPVPAIPPPTPAPQRGWKSGNNTGLTFGVGASYAFTANGAFRLEWQRFNNLGGSGGPGIDVDVVSLGAVYRF